MTPNDILRRLRYALDLSDADVVALLATGGVEALESDVGGWLAREEDPAHLALSPRVLSVFLDAVILQRRGPPAKPPPPPSDTLSNNQVLRKLRIALELHETAMVSILEAGGQTLSKSELSALFRNPGHRHYREAGDQVLRKFLRGLTLRLRGAADADDTDED